jgi:hypothetical protein
MAFAENPFVTSTSIPTTAREQKQLRADINKGKGAIWLLLAIKNAKVDLTTDTETTLYTTPSNSKSIVKSILVSNDTGSASTITVTLTDASAAVFSLFKVTAVGANTSIQLLTEPLILEENEILKVTAANANALHVIISILEIDF